MRGGVIINFLGSSAEPQALIFCHLVGTKLFMSTSPRKPARLLSRSSLMVAAALLGVAVSSTPKAQAANLYWDTDTATAGTGGTGIWTNDKSSNWSVTAAGDTAAGAGTFAVDDVAFFTGTAGTVNFSVLDIGGLVFRGADYVLNGITVNDTLILNSSSGAPVISVTGGNVATLSGILAGGTGLSKTGNGVLRLTNVSNNIYGNISYN